VTITGRALSGRAFRYAVTIALHDAGHVMTIDDLVRALDASGLALGRAPGKAVSDALRWEIRKHRVVRVERGSYRSVRLARSTKAWMRRVIDAELR
jgi:hypothetical protein